MQTEQAKEKGPEKEKLHIFINKIKFDENQGVKPSMLAGELADLVSVPRENAKITRKRDNKQFSVQDTVDINMADHFEIIRNVVEAGYANNPVHQRIRQELQKLSDAGGIKAELITEGGQDYVLFHQLETSGGAKGLPISTDVLVTIPSGYPASPLDMPALPVTSPLSPHVVGGLNPQHTVNFQGDQWRFLSFHPYSGAGAPMWTPTKHGFHDYYQHLYTWLNKI